jgi:protein phosphatase
MDIDQDPCTGDAVTNDLKQNWPETISSRVIVDLAASSHCGYVRTKNEDAFYVGRIERQLQTLLTNLPTGELPDLQTESSYVMLVADGMGGEAAGDVASREAVIALVRLGLETPDWQMRLDRAGANKVLARFDERFKKICETLTDLARVNPLLTGMGTTLTLAMNHAADLIIIHVGDTRAYLFHDGHLLQLTRDQTLAQDLADRGIIGPLEMKTHYARHLLTGVISASGSDTQPEVCKVTLSDGDQVLICSDGLTEMVSDAAIAQVLARGLDAEEACRTLIEMALEAGGVDNVTLTLGRYQIPAAGKSKAQAG